MSSSDGSTILEAYWIPFTFAFLTFCARMVSRIKFVRYVGPDDWVMVLAMVSIPLVLRYKYIAKSCKDKDNRNDRVYFDYRCRTPRTWSTYIRASARKGCPSREVWLDRPGHFCSHFRHKQTVHRTFSTVASCRRCTFILAQDSVVLH